MVLHAHMQHQMKSMHHPHPSLCFACCAACRERSMSYILTLAGLLSAALLWIGAALERVGKVFMFLGVMINWVGSTLQVGVGFAGIGAQPSAADLLVSL